MQSYIVRIHLFLYSPPKEISFITFRKRAREGKNHQSKRETSIGCLQYAPDPGSNHNLGMCPDWESNPHLQPFSYWKVLQHTEPHPHRPGQDKYF